MWCYRCLREKIKVELARLAKICATFPSNAFVELSQPPINFSFARIQKRAHPASSWGKACIRPAASSMNAPSPTWSCAPITRGSPSPFSEHRHGRVQIAQKPTFANSVRLTLGHKLHAAFMLVERVRFHSAEFRTRTIGPARRTPRYHLDHVNPTKHGRKPCTHRWPVAWRSQTHSLSPAPRSWMPCRGIERWINRIARLVPLLQPRLRLSLPLPRVYSPGTTRFR